MSSVLLSPSTTGADDSSKLAVLKTALYEAIVDNSSDWRLWTQKDLENLDIVPNNTTVLLRVIQELCNERLLRPANDGRMGICWRWRSAEDADK